MNRRSFLKGFAGALGATIILPPTVEDAAEMGRRIWALGGVPGRDKTLDADEIAAKREILADWNSDLQPGLMTIRTAWAEMGFWVGDIVAITDYVDPISGLVLPAGMPRRDYYRVQSIYWDELSAHNEVTLTELARYEPPKMPTFDFARFKELQA